MCKKEKPIEEFYTRKARRHGVTHCKSCWADIRKSNDYKLKFATRDKKNGRRYNEIHRDEKSEYNREYNLANREAINIRLRERKKYDIEFKILCGLKSRILRGIKLQRATKAYKTAELIGCSVPDLRKHIESQFDDKMTWENHGLRGWHIDHIKPCAAFDLTRPEEQKKCFHYLNLRPLWASDNLHKNSWHDNKMHRKNTKKDKKDLDSSLHSDKV